METKIKKLEQDILVRQKALHTRSPAESRRPPVALLQEIQHLKLALKELKRLKLKADKKKFSSL